MNKKTLTRKTTAKVDEPRIVGGDELFQLLRPSILTIPVPELGIAVRCRIPKSDEIFQMTIESAGDKAKLDKAIFKKCVVDLTPEQLDELEADNHGLRYLAVYNAVMDKANLFSLAVSSEVEKK